MNKIESFLQELSLRDVIRSIKPINLDLKKMFSKHIPTEDVEDFAILVDSPRYFMYYDTRFEIRYCISDIESEENIQKILFTMLHASIYVGTGEDITGTFSQEAEEIYRIALKKFGATIMMNVLESIIEYYMEQEDCPPINYKSDLVRYYYSLI